MPEGNAHRTQPSNREARQAPPASTPPENHGGQVGVVEVVVVTGGSGEQGGPVLVEDVGPAQYPHTAAAGELARGTEDGVGGR